ncbi:hypothetical protein RRG08_052236 [Elysia crispata]|uniref:Uncharacterized protein n=1 Tax=Elysia crispata TaxID=231223 RepID=A0AAE1BFE5_9GAST|nr:hypothetical protein RRG08_052236 [Elysia crispata]
MWGGSENGNLYSMSIIFQEVALRTEPYSNTGPTPEGEWGVGGGGSDNGDLYSMSIIFQEVALRTEPYSTTSLTPEGEWGVGGSHKGDLYSMSIIFRKWRSGQSLTAPQVPHPRVSGGGGGSDNGDLYSMSIIFQEVALRTEPYSTTGLTPEGEWGCVCVGGSDMGDLYSMSIIFQEVELRTEPYSTTGLTPEGEWGGGCQTRVTSTRCPSSSRKWRSGQSLTAPQVSHPRVSGGKWRSGQSLTAPQVSHPRVSGGYVCVWGSDMGDLYSMSIIFQEVALRTEPYSTTSLTPEDNGDLYSMSIIFQEVALRTEPYSTTSLTPEEDREEASREEAPSPLIRLRSVTPQAAPGHNVYPDHEAVLGRRCPDMRPSIGWTTCTTSLRRSPEGSERTRPWVTWGRSVPESHRKEVSTRWLVGLLGGWGQSAQADDRREVSTPWLVVWLEMDGNRLNGIEWRWRRPRSKSVDTG